MASDVCRCNDQPGMSGTLARSDTQDEKVVRSSHRLGDKEVANRVPAVLFSHRMMCSLNPIDISVVR